MIMSLLIWYDFNNFRLFIYQITDRISAVISGPNNKQEKHSRRIWWLRSERVETKNMDYDNIVDADGLGGFN